MLSNRVGLALIGTACVVAAGTGGFLATHHSAPAALVAPARSDATSETPGQVQSPPVQETEAIIDDAKSPASEAPPADAPAVPQPSVKQAERASTAPVAATPP